MIQHELLQFLDKTEQILIGWLRLELADSPQRVPKIDIGIGIFRIESDGRAKIGDRLLILAILRKKHAQILSRPRTFRLQPDHFLQIEDREFCLTKGRHHPGQLVDRGRQQLGIPDTRKRDRGIS